MTDRGDRARRSLRAWVIGACVMVIVHACAVTWLARWDAGTHLLARSPVRASDLAVTLAVYVLRLTVYLVLPPVLAWKAARALIEVAAARGASKSFPTERRAPTDSA